jgi:lipoprotein
MTKSSKGEGPMKKILTFILAALCIFSISILFTGCGTQTVDDLTGEYIIVKDGKEIKQDNKVYYLMILQKDVTNENKPAIKMRFTIQRYNPDLDKYYYVNRDFYMDPKTLQSFDSEKYSFAVNDDKNITLHGVKYKKVSSKTVTIDDTKYTADNLIKDLVKIPKFYEMDDTHISDSFSGFTTKLRQYVYY